MADPRPHSSSRWGLYLFGAFMTLAGLNHFLSPEFYLRIMPPWLPWHRPLVQISGIAEIVAGIGVLIPGVRRQAGWFAIALFVAVFPANVWMALEPAVWPKVPMWARWARLPLQGVFIWWAWAVTREG